MGQSVSGYFAADTHVVKFAGSIPKTCLNISEAFSICQLSKGHTKKLFPAGKALDFKVSVVLFDVFPKFVFGDKVHKLREDQFPRVHQPSPSEKSTMKNCSFENSNRMKTEQPLEHLFSMAYRFRIIKRWDSSANNLWLKIWIIIRKESVCCEGKGEGGKNQEKRTSPQKNERGKGIDHISTTSSTQRRKLSDIDDKRQWAKTILRSGNN